MLVQESYRKKQVSFHFSSSLISKHFRLCIWEVIVVIIILNILFEFCWKAERFSSSTTRKDVCRVQAELQKVVGRERAPLQLPRKGRTIQQLLSSSLQQHLPDSLGSPT